MLADLCRIELARLSDTITQLPYGSQIEVLRVLQHQVQTHYGDLLVQHQRQPQEHQPANPAA